MGTFVDFIGDYRKKRKKRLLHLPYHLNESSVIISTSTLYGNYCFLIIPIYHYKGCRPCNPSIFYEQAMIFVYSCMTDHCDGNGILAGEHILDKKDERPIHGPYPPLKYHADRFALRLL